MVPDTAEATETTSTELTDEEKAAITAEIEKLEAQMGAGFEESGVGFFSSPEGIKISNSIERLRKGKKAKKVIDPRKAEVKEALPKLLDEQAVTIQEQLMAKLVEKFPYLKELEGFTVDVKLKAKGLGRTSSGDGTTRSSIGRVLHRDKSTGKRIIDSDDPRQLNAQALPGTSKLCAAYPDQAEEIMEVFGTAEKRKTLWESLQHLGTEYTKEVQIELPDDSVLCIQK